MVLGRGQEATNRELSQTHGTFGSMLLFAKLSKVLGWTVLIVVANAMLVGGCRHPGAKDEGGDATVSPRVTELSPSLAGKRITVWGKFFMFKCGLGIGLDSGQAICLIGAPSKSGVDDPYAGMSDKPVEGTGTLIYRRDSEHDRYYFEKENTRVRILTEFIDNTTVSPAGSQLSQTLVGKRITIRGKLVFGFKCGSSIVLDDQEWVCLEVTHPKSMYEPYPGMFDKRVEATGTLRFFHDSTPIDETLASQRVPDHFYFETETTRVRLIPKVLKQPAP